MTNTIQAMRRVSAYRTSDGAVHEDRDTAVRHQAHLDLQGVLIQIHARSATQPMPMDTLASELVYHRAAVQRLLRLTQKGL